MDPSISQKIEAILFASGRYIDAKRIAELAQIETRTATRALKSLQTTYAESGSALQLIQEDNAWKLHVRNEFLELASQVVSDTEVAGPVIETLAIIAWQTPALQSKVVDVRGSNTYEHIKELVERGFVTKEPEGRSFRLKITEKFFEYFDVEGRDDIRRVFKEVEERHREKQLEQELHQKKLAIALQKSQEDQKELITEPVLERGNLEDLDEVLERSKLAREKLSGDIAAAKKQPEETAEEQTDETEPRGESETNEDQQPPQKKPSDQTPTETDEDGVDQDARAAREKAEAAMDELLAEREKR